MYLYVNYRKHSKEYSRVGPFRCIWNNSGMMSNKEIIKSPKKFGIAQDRIVCFTAQDVFWVTIHGFALFASEINKPYWGLMMWLLKQG